MNRTGVFLAEGLEEIEGLTVVDILRRAGIEVTTISISDKKEVTGSHKITVLADKLFSEVDFQELDGIVLPGGMPGTINLGEHFGVNEVIKTYAAEGKLVAAICAAPSVLGQAGLLEGKRATSYPGFEEKLRGAICCTEKVVQDENIITSRGMGTAIDFSLKLVELLLDASTSAALATTIQYGN